MTPADYVLTSIDYPRRCPARIFIEEDRDNPLTCVSNGRSLGVGAVADTPMPQVTPTINRGRRESETDSFSASYFVWPSSWLCVYHLCVCASWAVIGMTCFGSCGRAGYSNDSGEITLPFLSSLFTISLSAVGCYSQFSLLQQFFRSRLSKISLS